MERVLLRDVAGLESSTGCHLGRFRKKDCATRLSGKRGVRSAECGKCGVWKMWSVENAGCGKCGVWKMRSVENAECRKCGVWKMRSLKEKK